MFSPAQHLYSKLQSIRDGTSSGNTPEQELIAFCQTTLGGVERIHSDFKRKDPSTIGTLGESDKKNFSKALSGFANGGGGVLIWGIDDSTTLPQPVPDVARFLDSMLTSAHQFTSPAVSGVDGILIPSDSNATNGFAIVLVPESDHSPHRVIVSMKGVQGYYFVRSGSSFTRATHSQLEDMFGLRPHAKLQLKTRSRFGVDYSDYITVYVDLAIENRGRAVAKYPYLRLEVDAPHGVSQFGLDGNGKHGLSLFNREVRQTPRKRIETFACAEFGSQEGRVIHSGVTHWVTTLMGGVELNQEPYTADLRCSYIVAAEGMPAVSAELTFKASELLEIVRNKQAS